MESLNFVKKIFFGSTNVKENQGGVKNLLCFLLRFKIVYLRFFQGTVFDLL